MAQLQIGSPAEAGLRPEALKRAYTVLERWTADRMIPGAVLAVGRNGVLVPPKAFGLASLEPEERSLAVDAVYDLASLTKVVATTTCALILLEQGLFRLDDMVRHFVPEFPHEGVALRHLLTHTSGLPAWRPLHKEATTPADMMAALYNTPLAYETGARVEYSCLGYILLGELLRRVGGKPLHELADALVFTPLQMRATGYLPGPELRRRAVPTEVDSATGVFLQGIVHDENARRLGGVSGNAGLFSTAADLAAFCQMYLNKGGYGSSQLLSPATVSLAIRDHTAHLNDSRGLGWVVKGHRRFSSAGDLFSPSACGHTGFTGTSLWLDPERNLFLILLTNGVHPHREQAQHIRLRPLVANAVAAAVV